MTEIKSRTDFNVLRYANCWEDAEVLLAGLQPREGSRILSIGSAGDNSFSLLATNPECVIAADISGTQLALIALKKAAIQLLDYEEVLSFLGFRPAAGRVKTLQRLKPALEPAVFSYWEEQAAQIEAGIIAQGKFERYFQFFSRRILPWIHSAETVERLLSTKSAAEQDLFYHKNWNTWRWRLLFRIFFSKMVMGKWGRDPEFLREVKVPVGKTIFSRAEKQLSSVLAQQNAMLRYNLTGSFGQELPHYLQPRYFEKIKNNLHRLHLYAGYVEQALHVHGSVNYMNLSNIFEYMDPHTFQQTSQRLAAGLRKGGRVAYWNLLVPRRISDLFPEKLRELEQLSAELTARDSGFFYSCFRIEEAYG